MFIRCVQCTITLVICMHSATRGMLCPRRAYGILCRRVRCLRKNWGGRRKKRPKLGQLSYPEFFDANCCTLINIVAPACSKLGCVRTSHCSTRFRACTVGPIHGGGNTCQIAVEYGQSQRRSHFISCSPGWICTGVG